MVERVTARSGIVGRDLVLATCTSALEAARSGSGGLVLLAGEPGIGKTTVLQAVASRARSDGFVVAWAACVEDDAVPAFWPVVSLLAGVGHAETSAAAEELRGDEQGMVAEHRFVLFDRVASALRIAAATRPLVLVVDDLQWADASSVRLLAFVVKQIRTAPVLVVGSYRDTDVGTDHPLWHLLAEPGSSGETLTLSGLGTDDVAALLGDARGAGSAGGRQAVAGAASIRDHTGGNPFFVLNVARLLEAEGHDLASGRPLPLPAGVRAVLDRRLARLSQPCHELLGAAAVIGHRFDVALLTEVSGIQADVVAGLLEESARSRLTQPVGGTEHEFAHALVRATLTAQLATRQREALHGRVADALTGRRGEEDVRWAAIAHHDLSAGADRAATRGVLAAERAARHAMAARAFEAAAEQLERAVAASAEPEQEAHLLLGLGDAHLHGGDWQAAGDAFSRAADLARDLGRADLAGPGRAGRRVRPRRLRGAARGPPPARPARGGAGPARRRPPRAALAPARAALGRGDQPRLAGRPAAVERRGRAARPGDRRRAHRGPCAERLVRRAVGAGAHRGPAGRHDADARRRGVDRRPAGGPDREALPGGGAARARVARGAPGDRAVRGDRRAARVAALPVVRPALPRHAGPAPRRPGRGRAALCPGGDAGRRGRQRQRRDAQRHALRSDHDGTWRGHRAAGGVRGPAGRACLDARAAHRPGDGAPHRARRRPPRPGARQAAAAGRRSLRRGARRQRVALDARGHQLVGARGRGGGQRRSDVRAPSPARRPDGRGRHRGLVPGPGRLPARSSRAAARSARRGRRAPGGRRRPDQRPGRPAARGARPARPRGGARGRRPGAGRGSAQQTRRRCSGQQVPRRRLLLGASVRRARGARGARGGGGPGRADARRRGCSAATAPCGS